MATFEKQMIKERQMEGIAIAKIKGKYIGRNYGTKESTEKFLAKPKNKKIAFYLSSGYPMSEIVEILKCSYSTVIKVKKSILKSNY
jgi:DNA invertase Pin-like site-specific DNA recombinase